MFFSKKFQNSIEKAFSKTFQNFHYHQKYLVSSSDNFYFPFCLTFNKNYFNNFAFIQSLLSIDFLNEGLCISLTSRCIQHYIRVSRNDIPLNHFW